MEYPIGCTRTVGPASAHGRIRSSGTTLRPASQISTRPPLSAVAGAPRARPTVSVNPRLPPHPHASSRRLHPLMRANWCVRPPLPGPIASSPVHPKAQYVRPRYLFPAVPLWGTGPVAYAMPRPSLLLRLRLCYYVPGEPAPPPEDGGRVTNVQFYAGATTRGGAVIHGAAPDLAVPFPDDLETWFLGFLRGTPLPRKPRSAFPPVGAN